MCLFTVGDDADETLGARKRRDLRRAGIADTAGPSAVAPAIDDVGGTQPMRALTGLHHRTACVDDQVADAGGRLTQAGVWVAGAVAVERVVFAFVVEFIITAPSLILVIGTVTRFFVFDVTVGVWFMRTQIGIGERPDMEFAASKEKCREDDG